jgi:CheY-like chemotaxis protein
VKILYFDDEPFIAQNLCHELRFYGWNVVIVSAIDQLFQELANHRYDILILDIIAPVPDMKYHFVDFNSSEIEAMDGGMNTGIVLAEKIWEDKKNKDFPVLFLSRRRRPDEIIQFILKGKKCEYLRKPQLAKDIHATLQRLIY